MRSLKVSYYLLLLLFLPGVLHAEQMALPTKAETFLYCPLKTPRLNLEASKLGPVSFGAATIGITNLDMKLALPQFTGPVDIFIIIKVSVIKDTSYYLTDNGLHTEATAWKSNVTEPIDKIFFEKLDISGLPVGTYTVEVKVTPYGMADIYYLWSTYFIVGGNIIVSPVCKDFGSASTILSRAILNSSLDDVIIGEINKTGSDVFQLKKDECSKITLEAGNWCLIEIGFQPNTNSGIHNIDLIVPITVANIVNELHIMDIAIVDASQTYSLNVNTKGSGSGTITSAPAGIDCGSVCSYAFQSGTSVTLTATPAPSTTTLFGTKPGSTFGGWSGGACSGAALTCTVTMDAVKTVVATFNSASTTPGDSCKISISENTKTFTDSGGSGKVTVTASDSKCKWTATSDSAWISIGASSGTGSGTVSYTVAANTGAARSGAISISGNTYTVSQSGTAGSSCTISISPTAKTFGTDGGTDTLTITASASKCTWTATSSAPWITLGSPSSGTGSGTVSYTVAANTGAKRTGTVSLGGIGGKSLNISQEGCTITLSSDPETYAIDGGTGTLTVTASDPKCTWTATSSAMWIVLGTGSGSNTGSGTVSYTIAANTGAKRNGTVDIGDKSLKVSQEGCTITIAPTAKTFGTDGGPGTLTVTASDPKCTWTATTGSAWIVLGAGSDSGTGSGTVSYAVAANTGTKRTGKVSVGDQNLTVTQDGSITSSLSYKNLPINTSPAVWDSSPARSTNSPVAPNYGRSAKYYKVTVPENGKNNLRTVVRGTVSSPYNNNIIMSNVDFMDEVSAWGKYFSALCGTNPINVTPGDDKIGACSSKGVNWKHLTAPLWYDIVPNYESEAILMKDPAAGTYFIMVVGEDKGGASNWSIESNWY